MPKFLFVLLLKPAILVLQTSYNFCGATENRTMHNKKERLEKSLSLEVGVL